MWETIAAAATGQSLLWEACLLPEGERDPAAVFSLLAPPEHGLGLETIYEGYLVHYGRSRLFAPPDGDTALLLGDYLYAHGLVHVAESGDVAAVADLAELISLCAQARAAGTKRRRRRLGGDRVVARGGAASTALATRCARAAIRAASTRSPVARRETTRSTRPLRRTPGSSARVAAMLAALAPVLAAAKTAAEEGKDVVLSMLVVGLVFVGVVVLGDVWAWRSAQARAPGARSGR